MSAVAGSYTRSSTFYRINMSREVKIGSVTIGGGNPVAIQSMTNTPTRDPEATLNQIYRLYERGCDIVRASVPDNESADAFAEICAKSPIPVVADIHFDYKLAIKAVENGAAKVRINPGNLGGERNLRAVADCLKVHKVPVRVGVNAGSLDAAYKDMPLAQAMCESALEYCSMLEKVHFYDIVVSVKSSDVRAMVECNRMLAKRCDYPLHLGVTEAGLYTSGLVKSAAGIGALLLDGIGDTIRVSLTDDPVLEVDAGAEILKAVGRYSRPYVEVISCPTCARTEIDVKNLAREVTEHTRGIKKNLQIAVMGCVVNGIGESAHCDIGVAGGRDKSVIFKDGKILATVSNDDLMQALLKAVSEL